MNVEPVFESLGRLRIVGVERYTSNGVQAIQEAWQEITRRGAEVKHQRVPEVRYGFEDYSRDFKIVPGEFPKYFYLAGIGVDEIADIPDGMRGKEVPPAHYAVFAHRGAVSGIALLFRYIYDTWLPASAYVLDPNVQGDLERYTERMTDPQSMTSSIYIPIVKK